MSKAHVVQELCLEVDFDSEDQAFDAQERLAAFAQGLALRVLDEEFSRALGQDAVLRLPALELNLGWLPADADEAAWAERLRQAVQEALSALGRSLVGDQEHADRQQDRDGQEPQWRSADASDLDTLCHYLRHGQLPWHAAPATDPGALARAQWQRDPAALVAWLRTQSLDASLRQRLAWQLPAEWSDIQRALNPAPAPVTPPAAAALRRSPESSALRLPVRRPAPAVRAALRRLKALLGDDGASAADQDPGELLGLWSRLQADESDALRQLLRTRGVQARVRRRMAEHWPQALLLQTAALWLPQDEAARLEAAVRAHPFAGTARHEAWTRLLRELLAPAAADEASQRMTHLTAAPLMAAWLGAALPVAAPPVADTADVPVPRGAPAVGSSSATGTRSASPSWASRREQAARLTRESFALHLAQALGAAQAPEVSEALAALAFDALPSAWQGGGAPCDPAQRVQWALELIHATQPALVTPQALVAAWWRGLALQRLRSPEECRADLQAEPVDAADRARHDAWRLWLPATAAAPAGLPAGAAAEALSALSADAAVASPAALRLHLARGWGKGRTTPSELPRLLNGLSPSAWLWVLQRFLPAADSALLNQGLEPLAAVARHASGAADLRAQVLSALLWGGATHAVAALNQVVQALARAQDDSPALLARRAAEHARRGGAAALMDLFAACVPVEPAALPAAQALGQQRHRALLLRLVDAMAAAPAGAWDDVAQDWQTLRQSEPAALRALLRQSLGSARERQRVLAWMPAAAWGDLLALLLPDAPQLARAAEQLSRGAGPHVAVDWRDAVLAWVLSVPTPQSGPGGLPASAEALRGLLLHLSAWRGLPPTRLAAQAATTAAGAELSALFTHAAEALARSPQQRRAADTPEPPANEAASPAAATSLQALLRGPAEQARLALRSLSLHSRTRRPLAAQLLPSMVEPLLALYLPGAAREVAALLRLLTLEMSGIATDALRHAGARPPPDAPALPTRLQSADAARLQLAEQLLCSLPHHLPGSASGAPGPRLSEVLGALLEQAAWQMQITVPVLARRLQAQAVAYGLAPDTLAPWLTRTAPVPIPPSPIAADRPATGPLAATVAHLRASAGDTGGARGAVDQAGPDLLSDAPSDPQARAHWLALLRIDDKRTRATLARELESPLAAERLSALLGPDELRRALGWLRPADAAGLDQVWPALQALPAPPQHGWPAVARAVLRELFQEDRRFDGPGLLQRAAQALRRLAGGNKASLANTPTNAPTNTNTHSQTPASPSAPAPALAAAVPAPALTLPWLPPLAGEPVFIGNAGLVLAGPYLQRLFGLLKLVEDKSFVDLQAAQRATLLLQYLASGEAAAPEPELALNKLLCGLALDMPVPPAVELRAAEREAADGLLAAMIAHWSALGHTSPAGLRQTFLMREGRLEHADEAWQLHVPPQTFDMLLDRLPWGYSTVKFPWMPEVLHVQWR